MRICVLLGGMTPEPATVAPPGCRGRRRSESPPPNVSGGCFGDDWNHQITVDAVIPGRSRRARRDLPRRRPRLPAGRLSGPHGYARLLEALTDPDNGEHEEMQSWAGASTPEIFDLAAANRRLGKILV